MVGASRAPTARSRIRVAAQHSTRRRRTDERQLYRGALRCHLCGNLSHRPAVGIIVVQADQACRVADRSHRRIVRNVWPTVSLQLSSRIYLHQRNIGVPAIFGLRKSLFETHRPRMIACGVDLEGRTVVVLKVVSFLIAEAVTGGDEIPGPVVISRGIADAARIPATALVNVELHPRSCPVGVSLGSRCRCSHHRE